MTITNFSTKIVDMKHGQLFQFSRHITDSSIVWQKKSNRTISRINANTKEILATYYFTKEDHGYCLID